MSDTSGVRHLSAPLLLVVTGPPAAGKTTVALALRERLGLPLLAKDTIKETLGDVLEAPDRATSRLLGTATFALQQVMLCELLESGVSAISEGNFHPSWFEPLPAARIVQVHLTAALETLRDRMLARAGERHPVHRAIEAAPEAYERMLAGDWAPLPLDGELVAVDTTEWPDLPALVERVAAVVSAAGGG